MVCQLQPHLQLTLAGSRGNNLLQQHSLVDIQVFLFFVCVCLDMPGRLWNVHIATVTWVGYSPPMTEICNQPASGVYVGDP